MQKKYYMKKAFQVKNHFYLKQPTIFLDNKKMQMEVNKGSVR